MEKVNDTGGVETKPGFIYYGPKRKAPGGYPTSFSRIMPRVMRCIGLAVVVSLCGWGVYFWRLVLVCECF